MYRRAGYTLIEVLTVVGIVGLLAVLTLAAVQSARESARAAQCSNNLRQIGIALNAYVARESVYPTDNADPVILGPGRAWFCTQSPFVRILPELDQRPLFDALNLQVSQASAVASENRTAAATVLAVFLCPSDGAAIPEGSGPINYRVNVGTAIGHVRPGMEPSQAGPFEALTWVRPAEITDGLSTTAFVSEKSRGDGNPSRFDRRRDFWYPDLPGDPPYPIEEVISGCADVPRPVPEHGSQAGSCWMLDGLGQTAYNHAVGPNSATPDCSPHPSAYGPEIAPGGGIFAARSRHGSAVHVLTGDGGVHRVSSGVALPVWRALGTRAGGEVVATPW